MKKSIICLIFMLIVFRLNSQATSSVPLDSATAKAALNAVIKQAKYIIEARWIVKTGDYYYIENENQSYWRTMMKVTKVIRGSKIAVGDTIISIWKQDYKGNGPDGRRGPSSAPHIWHQPGISTSCLFLIDNNFPFEPFPDKWSTFIHTTYIRSKTGYFAALYTDSYPAVKIPGFSFKFFYEWYAYLKTFRKIKLPR